MARCAPERSAPEPVRLCIKVRQVHAPPTDWTNLADEHEPRVGCRVWRFALPPPLSLPLDSDADKIFLIGGNDGSTVEFFDGEKWEELETKFPAVIYGSTAISFGGKLWVIGGSSFNKYQASVLLSVCG